MAAAGRRSPRLRRWHPGPSTTLRLRSARTGRQVAFLTDRTGKWQMWVMNADGSNQRPLAPKTLSDITFQYDNNNDRMVDWGK